MIWKCGCSSEVGPERRRQGPVLTGPQGEVAVVQPFPALHNRMAIQSLILEHGLKAATVAVFALVLCVVAGCRRHGPLLLSVDPPAGPVLADGRSITRLPLHIANGRHLSAREVTLRIIEKPAGGRLWIADRPLMLVYQSGVAPGRIRASLSAGDTARVGVEMEVAPYLADTYRDGTPDFLRLDTPGDRQAFRNWFTLIAEWQAIPGTRLPPEIKDCAGLVRYSYREALRRHDAAWMSGAGMGAAAAPSDVQKYHYPYTPLGPRIFRVREGHFVADDLKDGTFAEFADVRTLVTTNTHFISRDVSHLRPGDLLFYRQFEQRSPFHSMVFVGRGHFGPGDDWLVYHTGNDAAWAGEMRHVTLLSLVKHPDARWHPVPGNRNFLGVYRFNILREAQ